MSTDDDVQALVVDNGSGMCKVKMRMVGSRTLPFAMENGRRRVRLDFPSQTHTFYTVMSHTTSFTSSIRPKFTFSLTFLSQNHTP